MDVIPHRHELAVGVEHLDAMRLTIGDVDVVIAIDHHVMRPDELAGVDARFPP